MKYISGTEILNNNGLSGLAAEVYAERVKLFQTTSLFEFVKQFVDEQVREFNDQAGQESDCPKCRGKCVVALPDYQNEKISVRDCECAAMTASRELIAESGLSEALEELTLDSFMATEDFQKSLKALATDYVENSTREWLVVLGQSGAGKTHICTAVCGEFLNQGLPVRYLRWQDEGKSIKRFANDSVEYFDRIYPYKTCDVLYIDDLFKRKKDAEVKESDINLAFELIDYRSSAKKRTIISGEDGLHGLMEIDAAIGGRIKQMSGKYLYQVPKGEENNYRLKPISELKPQAPQAPKQPERNFTTYIERSLPREDD